MMLAVIPRDRPVVESVSAFIASRTPDNDGDAEPSFVNDNVLSSKAEAELSKLVPEVH